MSDKAVRRTWEVAVRLDGDEVFSLDSNDMTHRTMDPHINQRVIDCLREALASLTPQAS